MTVVNYLTTFIDDFLAKLEIDPPASTDHIDVTKGNVLGSDATDRIVYAEINRQLDKLVFTSVSNIRAEQGKIRNVVLAYVGKDWRKLAQLLGIPDASFSKEEDEVRRSAKSLRQSERLVNEVQGKEACVFINKHVLGRTIEYRPNEVAKGELDATWKYIPPHQDDTMVQYINTGRSYSYKDVVSDLMNRCVLFDEGIRAEVKGFIEYMKSGEAFAPLYQPLADDELKKIQVLVGSDRRSSLNIQGHPSQSLYDKKDMISEEEGLEHVDWLLGVLRKLTSLDISEYYTPGKAKIKKNTFSGFALSHGSDSAVNRAFINMLYSVYGHVAGLDRAEAFIRKCMNNHVTTDPRVDLYSTVVTWRYMASDKFLKTWDFVRSGLVNVFKTEIRGLLPRVRAVFAPSKIVLGAVKEVGDAIASFFKKRLAITNSDFDLLQRKLSAAVDIVEEDGKLICKFPLLGDKRGCRIVCLDYSGMDTNYGPLLHKFYERFASVLCESIDIVDPRMWLAHRDTGIITTTGVGAWNKILVFIDKLFNNKSGEHVVAPKNDIANLLGVTYGIRKNLSEEEAIRWIEEQVVSKDRSISCISGDDSQLALPISIDLDKFLSDVFYFTGLYTEVEPSVTFLKKVTQDMYPDSNLKGIYGNAASMFKNRFSESGVSDPDVFALGWMDTLEMIPNDCEVYRRYRKVADMCIKYVSGLSIDDYYKMKDNGKLQERIEAYAKASINNAREIQSMLTPIYYKNGESLPEFYGDFSALMKSFEFDLHDAKDQLRDLDVEAMEKHIEEIIEYRSQHRGQANDKIAEIIKLYSLEIAA